MSISGNDALMGLMQLVDGDSPPIEEVILRLKDLAKTIIQEGPATRMKVVAQGAYNTVCRAWRHFCDTHTDQASSQPSQETHATIGILDAVLTSLAALMPGHPHIFDDLGWEIIMHTLDKNLPESTLTLLLQLLRNTFIKSERNREHFSHYLLLTEPLISLVFKHKITSQFLTEWCSAMKALFLMDDPRVAYNRAAERKQLLVKSKTKVLPILADCLRHREYEHEAGTLNAIVLLLSSMAVSDEMRLQMEMGNVLHGIRGIFKNHTQNKTLVRNSVSLLRLLCVNQKLRDKSAGHALMKWVVDILDSFKAEVDMVEEVVACLGYMTLRSPCQVAQFIAKQGLPLVQQLMKTYPNENRIAKGICSVLRNVAENGGDHGRDKIKEIGCGPILRDLVSTCPGLEQYFVTPVLKEIQSSSKTNLSLAGYADPLLDPQPGRQSVLIDENQ